MRKYYNPTLKKNIVEINIGDYYVTWKKDEVLYTVLGSCVSVCLWNPRKGLIGMNHYMLPEYSETSITNISKYGDISLPLLLQEMINYGSHIKDLKGAICGGSYARGVVIDVGESNIEIARKFLRKEKIPVMMENVGGNKARRIYFYAHNQRIKVIDLKPLNSK
ncbi:MAG: chemotaxis protein CheD [Candidatus Syntrophonatronum acetioxidans]|uniref:Probable chemoreceptor glutamine deamidase CheD n=1 Tax=Candidatus Syntrophonatronum acetioxidans TaxID=1795816 RepID=A0A424YDH0_9FIRM|nr:MAG: chemotaxis protein CheD [Candidatus Syntrophonatronum acetioxidans]